MSGREVLAIQNAVFTETYKCQNFLIQSRIFSVMLLKFFGFHCGILKESFSVFISLQLVKNDYILHQSCVTNGINPITTATTYET